MPINKRHQNNIKRMSMYPSANIGSDYNPVIGILRFKEKRVANKNKRKTYDISSLAIQEILRDKFNKHIRFNNNNNEGENIENQWCIIRNNIHIAVEKILGYRERLSRKAMIIS